MKPSRPLALFYDNMDEPEKLVATSERNDEDSMRHRLPGTREKKLDVQPDAKERPSTATSATVHPVGVIGRLGRGIRNDIRARAPWYLSDWKDAWNYRVVPATALIFFAKYALVVSITE